MKRRKEIIIGLIAAAVLVAAGVLIQRFFFQEENTSYVPSGFDAENCVVEQVDHIKPNQKLCVEHPRKMPAKTYYSDGWKVVCCKRTDN